MGVFGHAFLQKERSGEAGARRMPPPALLSDTFGQTGFVDAAVVGREHKRHNPLVRAGDAPKFPQYRDFVPSSFAQWGDASKK